VPSGAQVINNGVMRESGVPFLKVRWENKRDFVDYQEFKVELADYETHTERISNIEADAKEKWLKREVSLQPLTTKGSVAFSITPKDAVVTLAGKRLPNPGDATEVLFRRATSKSPWDKQLVSISANGYFPQTLLLDVDSLRTSPTVAVALEASKKTVRVSIECNEKDAKVFSNNKPIGATPLSYEFEFLKDTPGSTWTHHLVVVEKPGFRRTRKTGTTDVPPGDNSPFSVQLTLQMAEQSGRIRAELESIRYVEVPIFRVVFDASGPWFQARSSLSDLLPANDPAEKVSEFDAGALVDTRLSIMPNGIHVMYSRPRSKIPAEFIEQPAAMGNFFMNIWVLQGGAEKLVTDERFSDLDPTISADGQVVYFAANRLRKDRFNLWSVRVDGKGGVTKITESWSSLVDSEPALNQDGTRIAFTRVLEGRKEKSIWTCKTDGSEQKSLRHGENPAWSPDGKRLAFVAPDEEGSSKIWIMDEDGSKPARVSRGAGNRRHPVWCPDGNRIVFCSDETRNEEGNPTWNIWLMDVNASTPPVQLTRSGSHHERPAVSSDGKYVYFLTNRGAIKEREPFLQIFRIELEKVNAGAAPRQAKP